MEEMMTRFGFWVLMALAVGMMQVVGCKKSTEPPPPVGGEPVQATPVTSQEPTADPRANAPAVPRNAFLPLTPQEIEDLKSQDRRELTYLPTPAEALAAIANVTNATGSPNWATLVTLGTVPDTSDRVQLALAAGATIADFFLMVHARDAAKARKLADDLMTLADRLGMGETARKSGAGLGDAIDAAGSATTDIDKEWSRVRTLIDVVYSDIRTNLSEEMADVQTANLVALGAWLEGVRLVARQADNRYDETVAGLLRQPDVASFFENRLGELKGTMAGSALVPKFSEGLRQIRASMTMAHGTKPTADQVKEQVKLLNGLIALVYGNN